MTQIIFIPGVYFLCTTAKQCQLFPSHLCIHYHRCDIYTCNFDFIFWLICVSDQIRCSPVVLTMFLYFNYYTGNPVLVSSGGERDTFRVYSRNQMAGHQVLYSPINRCHIVSLLTGVKKVAIICYFRTLCGWCGDMLAVDGWCIELQTGGVWHGWTNMRCSSILCPIYWTQPYSFNTQTIILLYDTAF